MLIGVDLTQTPDVRQIVRAGIYVFTVQSVEDKPPKNPATKGMNIVLGLKISAPQDSIEVGREMTHYVFIPADSKRADAFTGIKRVFLSAGIPITNTGMNTALLIGRNVTAIVTNGVSKDDTTGQTRETYGISDVLIPGDNVPYLGEAPHQPNGPITAALPGQQPVQQAPQQAPPGLPGIPPAQQPQAGIHPSMMPQTAIPPGAVPVPTAIPQQLQAPVPQMPGIPAAPPQFAPAPQA